MGDSGDWIKGHRCGLSNQSMGHHVFALGLFFKVVNPFTGLKKTALCAAFCWYPATSAVGESASGGVKMPLQGSHFICSG